MFIGRTNVAASDPSAVPRGANNGSRGRVRAYEEIRQAIVEGRYSAGQRLVEKNLAEEFQVSRTPVREALRALESEGLVVSLPNKGAVVRSLSAQDVYDIYDLRVRLESLAAERAARDPGPDQLAVLEEANADFATLLPSFDGNDLGSVRKIEAVNRRFHQGFIDMAGSWRLNQLLERTVHAVLVFQNFQFYEPEELQRSLLFHQLIAQAIARREAGRAGNLVAEHILLGRDILVDRRSAAMAQSDASIPLEDGAERRPRTTEGPTWTDDRPAADSPTVAGRAADGRAPDGGVPDGRAANGQAASRLG
jgi:DNA-binding GntR family transcriptional regulator